MKKTILLLVLLFSVYTSFSQNETEDRIQKLNQTLESLIDTIPNLQKKVDFSLNNTELPVFLRAIAKEYKLNLSIAPSLKRITVSQNFSDATVKNVLLYLCKQHNLTIEVLGSILSIKNYVKPYLRRDIDVKYNEKEDLFSVDLQRDTLYIAFKEITKATGKNLVFKPGIGNQKISSFIQEMPFFIAMDEIALANGLSVTKTKDNYYLFEKADANNPGGITDTRRQKPTRYRNNAFYFKVLDTVKQVVDVDFDNTPISSVIKDVGFDLGVNMFTTTPLQGIGSATVKADGISYDFLLTKLLENTKFSYKKVNDTYFFGENEKTSLTSTETIPLLYRSIEIMDSSGLANQGGGFNALNNQSLNNNQSLISGAGNSNFGQNNFSNNRGFSNTNNRANRNSFQNSSNQGKEILSLFPEKIKENLQITTDVEQNAFVVSGNAQKIEAFKRFLKKIDKAVPVILIEVMIVEVSNSSSVSIGLDLGIGGEPTTDNGVVFPDASLALGASSINKVIGGFNGFGALNIGNVTSNFYARIEALESNGDIKIRSTPKLSTLNGHQATLSRGVRTYYTVTTNNIIGTQNPLTTETTNFFPIDANLSIGIRPLVSGNGNITLSINVQQSDFNGERIDPQAPPGVNSREFTSTIRVKDKDVVILGGIEESSKNNSGSGVPFLARVPIIKWLFSKRTRTASKSKLSILIKPTVIY